MAENLITPEKSLHEDDTLHQLSYKQLQQLAMSMKLPANLKHGSLLALIKARQAEDTNLVERIVSENRQLRNRARVSRTTSTSPGAESLTLSPPISPECLLRMSSAAPVASSSPKTRTYQNASKSFPQANESLPRTEFKTEQMEGSTDAKPTMLKTTAPLQFKESFQPHAENENAYSSGTLSSDRSPDPLELGSPSTYGSDSVTNSVGSDLDPLVSIKECLNFPDKEIFAKDLTELKPVPPSDLVDLSLSEPLLDSGLVLRPAFSSESLQSDALLHPVHTTLTQALIPYTPIEEGMTTNPLVNLCAPDTTVDGQVKSSIPQNKRVEYTHATVPSHTAIPPVNITVEEPSMGSQRTYSQKRQSEEFDYSPSKTLKTTPAIIPQPKMLVLAVSSNPLPLPLVSREDFPKIPDSLPVATVPTATCSSTITLTMTSMTPARVVHTTSSFSEGEKFEQSITSRTSSGNFSSQGINGSARKSVLHFSTSPVSTGYPCLPTHSSSLSTKTSPPETWHAALPKSNTQISESNLNTLSSAPRKVPAKSTGIASKGNVSNKLNTPIKKTNIAKLSHQELCYLDFLNHVQHRPVTTQSQTSPVVRTMANPIYSTASNPPYSSRQNQNIRPSSQHAISSLMTSTFNAPRRLDQPVALPNNPSVFATPTVPTRNQPNVTTPIPRPSRPESVLNFLPTSYPQTNPPSINHLCRDQADNQKHGQNRQPEVCTPYPAGHGDFTGEPLPNPVQPRVDLGTHLALPLPLKTPQMDFPPAQSVQPAFVSQNLAAVGQNLPHDSCLSTLRQLLEAPLYSGLPNRDSVRRHPGHPYQYENQNVNQFIRPPLTDHFKDTMGIGQMNNYPLQSFPRMPFMPLKPPESTERLKTKDFFNEQRLALSDLPKSLESILNYRSDALNALSTSSSKLVVRSDAIDALFVTCGKGPTQSVDCYGTPICSVKSKPARNCYVGIGSHQTVERHRSSQEFVPYSSNYLSEQQNTDMYGSSSLNAALNQPCEPPWFSSEPCLPAAVPVNQYWPQAVNPQPAMRLPQPFRAVNQRNAPNQYYSPLKSLQMPNPSTFFNQPPISNVGYQSGMPNPSTFFNQPPINNMGYQSGMPSLPDIQSYQQPESFDKVLPLQENMAQLAGQDLLPLSNQAMNQCQNQVQQDVPDFQGRGDQLSLSMIYNYLASTEHQMLSNTPRPDHFDNQSQINQRPVYSRPIFPGTNAGQYQQQFGNASDSYSAPSQSPVVGSAPTSRPKCGNGPAKSVTRRQEAPESTTLTKEAATASVIALRKQSKERQKCINSANGCSVILPLSQLAAHEECCEYINLKCPKESCEWNGRARKLANHVREAHRTEINSGTDSKHSLPHIESLESVCFLQEVSRKLFAICVNCHGGVLYVSIQYIASGRSERPTSACGCIEVLGHDGHPHSWRGKLLPYYQSVETLLTTSSCLEVSLNTLGAFAGSTVTLHINIRVYSGNTNSNAQPGN